MAIDFVVPRIPATMPPKNTSGKEKLVDEEDEILQAVILADSFDKRFKPLTASRPRVSEQSFRASLAE